ncbi:MAG: 6,7-dimethyl-8-ribityllumazine synthase [Thermococcaceae archaeon]|jgi:6,7-dimethyl-8-ribityllumazine synthase|uniref:6,7-dimethyl-8-ribityllumazine synthase n=1 Tax=Thermococcus TaxID=2263 RepID=UPI00074AC83D|nr:MULTISPECIES: 6,7-dimethyl-8-ribityllumazine synthase [Thermococcus]KUJ99034.1 MAG: 6,7-dimethyl-8-ribityllumazine synthase [Thermococcales archaeon 44_46]MDK2982732.1 6,7-dimethyl-8-ribityllumazine synthase [Thermococcaceae archaeon]MCA6213471.1 6,7-dimethyl-8-ribityllumazine synthase [Thermococcus bergensis]MDN5319755.1 6,7-dimethyl-8-ribityllumazine synthase [Thermococcaceae archaeon]MPW38515.1 6,7-dimethyl-8-ribityllumazine synthase [Thermococcus sp. 101 C5]
MIYEGEYKGEGLKIGIVVSRFNDLLTKELLDGALDCLKRHGVKDLDIFKVPGAFEIPFITKELAKKEKYDAILALGAVVKGETYHFDLVANEVAKGVAHINLTYETPVIFGVITVDDGLQGLDRAGIKSNKGFEYALATLEMANLRKKIKNI